MSRALCMMTVSAVLGTSACIDTPPMAEPEVEQSRVELKELPGVPIRKHDVLIVVDDSLASAAYRDQLAALPRLVTRSIHRFAGSWSDTHIAVAGSDGRLRRVPGTGDAYLSYVRDYDFTTTANYAGPLRDTLAAMMSVDASPNRVSQPLDAMRRALESAGDFMRSDATLAILLVSAADDASPYPAADYATWTRRLELSWPHGVWVGTIYPDASPRLDEYVEASMHHAFRAPIDGGLDYAVLALEMDWGIWGGGCVEEVPVRLPGSASDQYDCVMMVQIGDELRTVPQCDARTSTSRLDEANTEPPSSACWALRPDPADCFYGGLAFELDGYTNDHHPAFRFECRTQ